MKIETQAIVLKRFSFGDTSQVAHLLTPMEGRLSVLAKGIKKPNPSLKGPMDLFHLAQVTIHFRKASELALLTRYEPITGFSDLREHLERLYAAFYLAELVYAGTRDNRGDPEPFKLLARALAQLSQSDPKRIHSVVMASELRFLDVAGFGPALSHCAGCGQELAGGERFVARAGGFLCQRCPAPAGVPARRLDLGIRALLRQLSRAGPQHAERVGISAQQLAALRPVIRELLWEVLERPLKSDPFVWNPEFGMLRRLKALPRRSVDASQAKS